MKFSYIGSKIIKNNHFYFQRAYSSTHHIPQFQLANLLKQVDSYWLIPSLARIFFESSDIMKEGRAALAAFMI